MATIIETRQLTPVTKYFRIEAPLIASSARPGQFVMLRVREGGERIPITIAPGGHVCGVGGGFGSAALLCLMREFTARGDRTTAILGARNKELLILADELRPLCTHLEICTDDGSAGFKGFVTQRLAQLIDGDAERRPDSVVAIGPMAMMRAVAETTRASKVRTLVSMDPLMVDGTGMCGGCRVTVGGKAQFACVDGPCFDAHEVDFDVAMRRNKAYVKEEKQALDRVACMERRESP